MNARNFSSVVLARTNMRTVARPFLCSRSHVLNCDRRGLRLEDTLSPWRQQSASHEIQIRKRERGKGSHRVLREPAVSDLGKAPQAFDHVESEFAPGAVSRAPAVDEFVVCAEFLARFGPPIYPVADARVFAVQAMILTPVGLIAVEFGFLAVHQIVQTRDVSLIGRARSQTVHQSLFGAPDMKLHAEVP